MTEPVKIAVVDDDESVRESLLELVDSIGYDVTHKPFKPEMFLDAVRAAVAKSES